MTFILGWHQTNSTNSEYESCLYQTSEANKLSLDPENDCHFTVDFFLRGILLLDLDYENIKINPIL